VVGGGLFASERLIILTNFLKADSKGVLAEEIKKLVTDLPDRVFMLLVEGEKITWTKGLPAVLDKLIKDNKVVKREFIDLSPIELEQWIVTQAKVCGGNMPVSVARLLGSLVGNDFWQLTNEIAKLVAYAGGEPIKAVDLDKLVIAKVSDNVFALTDALGRRDLVTAYRVLEQQLSQGARPEAIVGLIAWQIRILSLVREALDNGGHNDSAQELSNQIGIHKFVITKALQQIPYYSVTRLAALYSALSELDVKLKTTQLEPTVLFGLFFNQFINLPDNSK
jgi:DNA polymerase-3 subunit delta